MLFSSRRYQLLPFYVPQYLGFDENRGVYKIIWNKSQILRHCENTNQSTKISPFGKQHSLCFGYRPVSFYPIHPAYAVINKNKNLSTLLDSLRRHCRLFVMILGAAKESNPNCPSPLERVFRMPGSSLRRIQMGCTPMKGIFRCRLVNESLSKISSVMNKKIDNSC